MSSGWIIAVPNNKENADTTFSVVSNQNQSSACNVYRFKIPELVIGTLDSLLALSDDLTKFGSQVENVVKKVERQYIDIGAAATKPLRVNEAAVETFFQKFQWDYSQYTFQGKPLGEIVAQIQMMAAKKEEELKLFANTYQEKNSNVAAARRRQTVNLITSDFEDFLKPEKVARVEFLNTENLLTVTVAVPKSAEQEFLSTYHTLGKDIAAYNNPDRSNAMNIGTDDGKFGASLNRKSVTGSPVVPESAKLLHEENESCLYAMTILKGHYQAGQYVDNVFIPGQFVEYLDAVRIAFREKRFVLREFTYDANKSGGIDAQITQAENELKQTKATIARWCKTHFGEVYSGWMHLKVIQLFVESSLRYGVPPDFVPMFVLYDNRNEKEIRTKLTSVILNLRPELRLKRSLATEEGEDVENVSEENLPYVCLRFPVIGSSA